MNLFLKMVVFPSLLGGLLGFTVTSAHADCVCQTIARLLSPQDVPEEVCPEDDVECVEGFHSQGQIVVHDSQIRLDIYPSDGSYLLEPAP